MELYAGHHWAPSLYKSSANDNGVFIDRKACWNSTEKHFMCLDTHDEVYGKIELVFGSPCID
jgi:hypothetical protein